MLFIGDIHGDLKNYERLIHKYKSLNSIQVGDFGVGFPDYKSKPVYINNIFKDIPGTHRFIRGNHDHPESCMECHSYIPDGHIENNMMFIGGASSIDKAYRTEGRDWWRNEELSYSKLMQLLEVYEKNKPEIMVTHDCPEFVTKKFGKILYEEKSITRQAFDEFFKIHKPKYWIFGHWHISFNRVLNDCNFVCLNISETIELNV